MLRTVWLCLLLVHAAAAQWRAATPEELKSVIPARAVVEKERIETEERTSSGITNNRGKFVAGVVLITAGYSAEGKYSHYVVAQVPIKVGQISLKPGTYVFGWRRGDESLAVKFYDAVSGKLMGDVTATRSTRAGRIESFRISPPSEKPMFLIGRFGFPYQLGE